MLEQHIEALIFASDNPCSLKDIEESLNATFGWQIAEKEIKEVLNSLMEKFAKEEYSFEIRYSGGGSQFMTKNVYA